MIAQVISSFAFMQYVAFEDILIKLEQLGLFEFILPLLLMFAIVYGVLSWTSMFGGEKPIHALIAIVLAFLAIRWPVYRDFLAIVSPKLGVGLTIILVLVLLMGLFIPEKSQAIMGWIMIGVAVVIALVIFAQSYSDLQGAGYGSYVNSDMIGWVIIVALLIGVIVAVVTAGASKKEAPSKKLGRLWDSITGGN
ncbi:hypothetical protein GW924_01810 [Candidatus Pacearchaeota archaeon]|nr:hypothetical protein [Candidatus Pacearchaeota archaeon]OIO42159.1 MAG: hypothetical protein AUJ64_04285 [Candidatus Pacearchaeota archaeon CG1_02_39_14]